MAAIVGLYILSYLAGAVPMAYIIGKLAKGIDIRKYGSGNVGGGNVFHHVGKVWVLPLGLFEVFIKGASPIWISQHLLGVDQSSTTLLGAPLLAIIGNNWSVFLKFQGGRGIVVILGALLALSPLLLLVSASIALAGWAITRSSGVWVLISLVLLPLWAIITGGPDVITWYCVGALALVVSKRLLSNWTPLPAYVSKKKVLFNRLLRDRDLDDRGEWVKRIPGGTR